MVLHVIRNRRETAFDAQLFATRLLNQLAHIPETYGEILDQAYGMGLLPGVVLLFGAPLDEPCPTWKRGQLQRKIILPKLLRNAENLKAFKHNIFRLFRQLSDLPPAVFDAAWRPVQGCKRLPCLIESFFSKGHRPRGMAFIQERFTPLDEFGVD